MSKTRTTGVMRAYLLNLDRTNLNHMNDSIDYEWILIRWNLLADRLQDLKQLIAGQCKEAPTMPSEHRLELSHVNTCKSIPKIDRGPIDPDHGSKVQIAQKASCRTQLKTRHKQDKVVDQNIMNLQIAQFVRDRQAKWKSTARNEPKIPLSCSITYSSPKLRQIDCERRLEGPKNPVSPQRQLSTPVGQFPREHNSILKRTSWRHNGWLRGDG